MSKGFIRLPRKATADLVTAGAKVSGGIVFDTTTSTVKYCDGSSWANVAGAAVNHAILSSSHSDSSAAAVSRGALIYGNSTPAWAKLAVGSAGQILKTDGTDVSWGTLATSSIALTTGNMIIGAASVCSALDVKGDGYIIVGNGVTATSVPVSGDCTLASTGAMTVTDLTIANEAQGDILYRGAAGWVRLAKPGGAGQYLEGGTTPQWSSVSAGVASSLANSVTCEAGAFDYTIAFGAAGGDYNLTVPAVGGSRTFAFLEQAQSFTAVQKFNGSCLAIGDTDSSHHLTLKWNANMAANQTLNIVTGAADRTVTLAGNITTAADFITVGANSLTLTTTGITDVTLPTTGTLATLSGTETLAGKTLTTPKIVTTGSINDAGGDEYLVFVEAAGAPTNYIEIQNSLTATNPVVRANGSDDNIGLLLYGKGTGKVTVCDSATTTKMLNFNLAGATATKTMTLISSHSDDRALTLPNATDTLVGRATSDTLTNKSLDCDGAGNALTNVNAEEVDSVPVTAGTPTKGIPIIYTLDATNVGGDATIIANPGFKFVVMDAWSINQSADGGTWQLKNGTSGNFISNQVTVAANDQDIDRVSQIDDTEYDIGAAETLTVTCSANLDAKICVLCMRSD